MTCHLQPLSLAFTLSFFFFLLLLTTINCQQPVCKQDMMHMSQGHFNITQQNYKKFKDTHKTFILSITDSKCPSCCQIEQRLKGLKDYLDSSKFYKGKQIKLVRLDLANVSNDSFLQKIGINVRSKTNVVVPSILIYKASQYYFIPQEIKQVDRIIHYINRVLHPFVKLESQDEIERFLAFYRLYPEENPFIQFKGQNKQKEKKLTHGPNVDTEMELNPQFYARRSIRTRVIAFFEDIKEFQDQYKEFKKAAIDLVKREDLRIGLVTDKKLINEMYNKHKFEWFGEFYKTSLIIKRHDSSVEKLDFITTGHSFRAWINRKSLNAIEKYSFEKQRIMDMLMMPIFGAFVDARHNSPQEIVSKNLIEDLKDISVYLKNQFIVTYFDGHQNDNLRTRFGIQHRRVPAIGIYYYDELKQGQSYPHENDFSQSRIKNWINNIMKGNIQPGFNQSGLKRNSQIRDIISSFQNIKLLGTKTFEDKALKQSSYDILLITFTFTKQFNANEYKILFSECSRFNEWVNKKHVNTLEIVAYDIGQNGQPDEVNKEFSKQNLKEELGIYFLNVKDKKIKEFKPKKNKKIHLTSMDEIKKFAKKNSGYSSTDFHRVLEKDV